MNTRMSPLVMSFVLLAALGACSPTQAKYPFVFEDAGNKTGLFPHVGGIAGHAAAWGDVDGDGWPELYVGTFGAAPYGSKDNMFFRNIKGKFQLDGQKDLRIRGRGNGAVFADFDNDGDLDFYFSNHAIDWRPYKQRHFSTPNAVFRNEGANGSRDGKGRCGHQPTHRHRSIKEIIMRERITRVSFVGLVLLAPLTGQAAEKQATPWLKATAYAIPKETTNQGSGYFSIVEGHNGRLYIGCAKYGVNAYLVEFDPRTKQMKIVVDAHKEIGTRATGFAAQSKIHTRNNVGKSGKIYFATKQGYPDKKKGEKRTDYPGGYPMVYDPKTGKTRVYPIPIKHQGIISITPDESRGVAYISTCNDARPIESTHFMILDLKTSKYRDLMDCQHMYAFIVVDHRGRAYHPILGGDIARYDPRTDKLERLKQTIDGKPPTKESLLAHPKSHPINWDISPDGKTLYSVAMSGKRLYSYDLTQEGSTLNGRSLGPLVPGATRTDCRALCVGPKGEVWAAVTATVPPGKSLLHLVRYRAGDKAPKVCGMVEIANPNYTTFTDSKGKHLPWHHGIRKLPNGKTTTRYVILGVCQGRDGSVYALSLAPFTLLQVPAKQLR